MKNKILSIAVLLAVVFSACTSNKEKTDKVVEKLSEIKKEFVKESEIKINELEKQLKDLKQKSDSLNEELKSGLIEKIQQTESEIENVKEQLKEIDKQTKEQFAPYKIKIIKLLKEIKQDINSTLSNEKNNE
ncbi:MAG: hypothetical protein KAT68_02130 [Bacteroidales bacterium]|nr:hypothetical protein [Bacteroidales bacterium]